MTPTPKESVASFVRAVSSAFMLTACAVAFAFTTSLTLPSVANSALPLITEHAYAWAADAQDSSQSNSTQDAVQADSAEKIIRVGYYTTDPQFQSGYADDQHKSGFAYAYLQGLSSVAGWDYEYTYVTREEIINALKAGDVDLVAGLTPNDDPEGKLLFSDESMGLDDGEVYFAVNANNPELMDEINVTQKRILRTSPRFLSKLIQKYYGSDVIEQGLTDLQADWLQEKGELTFGYVLDNLPISGQSDTNEPIGVAGVIYNQVHETLDIPVSAVAYTTVDEMLAGLDAREVDFIFPIYSDLWLSETNGIIQTHDVASDRAMIVYLGDYRSDLTDSVGVYETGLQQEILVYSDYPSAKITTYPNRENAFAALRNHQVNCIIGCSTVLERYLSDRSEYADINTAFLNKSEGFSMAVHEGDGVLAGILNRVVNQMEDSRVTAAMIEYARADSDYSLSSLIRHNAVPVVLILSLFIAILLFVFISYRRRTLKFNREQERTHQSLEQAVIAANAANNAKTVFLSSMSHDIRTPMNGIVGMTTIAQANIHDTDKVKSCLDTISVSSKHLLELINDVLDMSKIESGEMSLNEAPVSLSGLIDELTKVCAHQAHAKDITFISSITDVETDNVLADKVRLQQVFMNLVGNAVKYTPNHGEVQVTLAQVPSVDPKRYCYKFIVKDNGVGMSEEFLPHIFDPFSREEKPSAQGGEQGTGLGMAIVNNMVRMMGGNISVKSTLGLGSEFIVTLYLMPADRSLDTDNDKVQSEDATAAESADAKGEGEEASSLVASTPVTDFSGRRALLVEDNELNAHIAQEILKPSGIILERAHDGKEGVDMMAASEPGYYDCIFMDIQMPIMNGFEAARAIRSLDREDAKIIPIFAMTADAFNEDKQQAFESGMNEHFTKPLDFDLVIARLQQYLNK